MQTSTNDYFAYQDLVETGQSIGQRAFMTGPGVFSSNDFQSYDATLAYLRRYKEHYRTVNIKSYAVGNRQQRQWVVKAAEGRADEINTCIACNQACLDLVFQNKRASCLVNPRACHELELNYRPAPGCPPSAEVGAGPAGGWGVILVHTSR